MKKIKSRGGCLQNGHELVWGQGTIVTIVEPPQMFHIRRKSLFENLFGLPSVQNKGLLGYEKNYKKRNYLHDHDSANNIINQNYDKIFKYNWLSPAQFEH